MIECWIYAAWHLHEAGNAFLAPGYIRQESSRRLRAMEANPPMPSTINHQPSTQ